MKKLLILISFLTTFIGNAQVSGWVLSGNSNVSGANNKLGSINSNAISIITNNTERIQFTSNARAIIKVPFYDGSTIASANFTTRVLSDNTGVTTYDWQNRTWYSSGNQAFKIVSPGHYQYAWTPGDKGSISFGPNTGFDSTLLQNTVFGYQCLGSNGEQSPYPKSLTTGQKNSLFGSIVAFHLTSGSYNTLMGAESGEFFEDAFNCAAYGFHAQNGNKHSQQNTAFGAGAMQGQYRVSGGNLVACNTFPVNSTAVGYNALATDTTFDVNDAFGSQSLEMIQSGYSNIAMGQQSLSRITGGHDNTTLGNNAGGIVKGSPVGNTLIGSLAGYGDNTNSYNHNVVIGASAGQSLTTGSDNIIIGYQANATVWGNLNGKLWIDNGNNATPLIYGDLYTQRIGLGTTSPDSKLHIVGQIKIVDTFQGTGKVLTSDANGLGTWQSPGIVPHTVFIPVTTATITVTDNAYNAINPAGTIAALTVNFPNSPSDGDFVEIKFTQIVTTVTYVAGTGGATIKSQVNGTVGGYYKWLFDIATNSWY